MYEVINMKGIVLKRIPELEEISCKGCYFVEKGLECDNLLCEQNDQEYLDAAIYKPYVQLKDIKL